MRLVTFSTAGDVRLGAIMGETVVDLAGAYAAAQRMAADRSAQPWVFPFTVLGVLQVGGPAREAAEQALSFAADPDNLAALRRLGLAFPASGVHYLPPILRPSKILCLGHNYRQHVQEMKQELPTYPVLFAKFANTLVGHQQPIVLPRASTMVDYEAELAVVIGRTAKHVPRASAMEYIAGYVPFNDVSVRDFQRRTPQWLQGKTFDSTGPMGPALVTADEIADPHRLDVTLRLNGQVMQQANTSDFIFDLPTIVEYVTQILTLDPGDIIATGTPSGVGAARDPQVFLKPGDVVQVEIAGLGVLENPVMAPAAATGAETAGS